MVIAKSATKSPEPDSLCSQREKICDLIASEFVELRSLEGEQARDLAYAFHNLPKEIYGWGTWSVEVMRARLGYCQSKHKESLGFDYVDAFDTIFSDRSLGPGQT
jgi:hypothetical protein